MPTPTAIAPRARTMPGAAAMKFVDEFSLLRGLVSRLFYKRLSLHSDASELTTLLQNEPHLVLVLNHGPMSGPIPSLLALQEILNRHGGGYRRMLIVAWRYLYRLPLVKDLVTWATQTDHQLDTETLIQRINSNAANDIVVMPEGENAMFGNGDSLQPFLSPRFVEIALRTGAPIIIVTHRGTRHWSRHFPDAGVPLAQLPWLTERIRQLAATSDGLTLPWWTSVPLADYPWHFERYQPELQLAEFEALPQSERRQALQKEADRVHARMRESLERLPQPQSCDQASA